MAERSGRALRSSREDLAKVLEEHGVAGDYVIKAAASAAVNGIIDEVG